MRGFSRGTLMALIVSAGAGYLLSRMGNGHSGQRRRSTPTTPSTRADQPYREMTSDEDRLDEAIDETFPASDLVSTHIE